MINKAILVGNLGDAPEIKETNGGKTFAKFSVATSKRIKQGDEWTDVTQWHNCVCWREATAKYLRDYAKKGTRVYVEGEITHRSYEKDGVTKYATDIVVGGYDGEIKILSGGKSKDEVADSAAADDFGGADDLDDEIPF